MISRRAFALRIAFALRVRGFCFISLQKLRPSYVQCGFDLITANEKRIGSGFNAVKSKLLGDTEKVFLPVIIEFKRLKSNLPLVGRHSVWRYPSGLEMPEAPTIFNRKLTVRGVLHVLNGVGNAFAVVEGGIFPDDLFILESHLDQSAIFSGVNSDEVHFPSFGF